MERKVNFGRWVLVLDSEGQLSGLSQGTVSKFKEVGFEFYLGADCIGLKLDDDRVVPFRAYHQTVLIQIFRFELG